MGFVLQPPEEQTDNWDDDFEEGISFSKLQGTVPLPSMTPQLNGLAALDRTTVEDDKHESDDNAQTIRANRSPGQNLVSLAQPPSSSISPIMEDYSDIAEADELDHKVADFKVCSMLIPWGHF